MGHFLVNEVKRLKRKKFDADGFDTLAVLADNDAIEFFEKQNFTQDKLICSRYEDLQDTWTDCVIMIYIPEFFDSDQVDVDSSLQFVDKEQELIQKDFLKSYQKQFELIEKLKNEVIATRKIIDMQNRMIYSLTKEVMTSSGDLATSSGSGSNAVQNNTSTSN